MKYSQIYEGDWYPMHKRGQKLGCCDCALIHTINFRQRNGTIEMQFFRDNRATAAKRRHRGLKIVNV